MRRISVFLILTLAFIGVVNAAEQADIDAFKLAWTEYTEAVRGEGIQRQIETAENAVLTGRKALGEADSRLPALLINLGVAYMKAQQKSAAEVVLEEALALTKTIHGEKSVHMLDVLPPLADARSAAYRNTQLGIYKRALKIAIEHYGKESDEYASLALRAGINVFSYSTTLGARRYLIEAHKYFLSTRGSADIETGIATFYLGKYDFYKRQYKKSIVHLLNAIDSFVSTEEDTVHYQMVTRALLVQAYESGGNSAAATQHCVAIGTLRSLLPETDYRPIFRMAPKYPTDALRSGKQGYVDFSFTVDADGFVREAAVLDSSKNSRDFRKAALAAVERFRYAPRIENGAAVSVKGVETRISFKIE